MRHIRDEPVDLESEQSQSGSYGININISPPKIQYDPYNEIGIIKKILFIIGFILFGNVYFIFRKFKLSKYLHNALILLIDLISIVALFFPMIFLNIISLLINFNF